MRTDRQTDKQTDSMQTDLQFLGLVSAERLQGEAEVVGLGHGAQVEVVLSVDAGRDVDVELQQLQEVALQLVPVRGGGTSC